MAEKETIVEESEEDPGSPTPEEEEEFDYSEAFRQGEKGELEDPDEEEDEDEPEEKGDEEEPEEPGDDEEEPDEEEEPEEKKPKLSAKEQAEKAGQNLLEAQMKALQTREEPKAPAAEAATRTQDKKTALPDSVFTGEIDLTDQEKEYLEEEPELKPVVEKLAKKLVKQALESGEISGIQTSASLATVLKGLVGEVGQLRFMVDLVQVMPDAIQIGNSKVYKDWVKDQPKAIQALHKSLNVEDALTLLNYYKEDIAKKKVGEHDKETKKKSEKVDKLLKSAPKSSKRPKTETEEDKKKKQSYSDAFREGLSAESR